MKKIKRVSKDGFTVVWPDGQDICPDDEKSERIADKLMEEMTPLILQRKKTE